MPRDVVHRQRRILFVGAIAPFGANFLSQLMDRDLLDFEVVPTGLAALDVLSKRVRLFDAIMVCSRLPDGDGADLCARMRRRDIFTPVMIIAQEDSEYDVVRGLDCGGIVGAEDALGAKPSRPGRAAIGHIPATPE